MKRFRATVDQFSAAKLGARRRVGGGDVTAWTLEYRPGWIVSLRLRLKRLMMKPRVLFLTVAVDGLSGKGEECVLDPRLLVEADPPVDGILDGIGNLTQDAAEQVAHDVALNSVMKKNHTFWVPEMEIAQEYEVCFPYWTARANDGRKVWIDAVTGQMAR